MSEAKHYTIFLEVAELDGRPCVCELTLTPIGSLGMTPASSWMHLLNSLSENLTMRQLEEAGFSRYARLNVRRFS